jgi:hypothetical protein
MTTNMRSGVFVRWGGNVCLVCSFVVRVFVCWGSVWWVHVFAFGGVSGGCLDVQVSEMGVWAIPNADSTEKFLAIYQGL